MQIPELSKRCVASLCSAIEILLQQRPALENKRTMVVFLA
jgi:hypothetical protein